MERILKFELELRFPAELDRDTSTLMETIADAIRDYDNRRRLLPGRPTPRGGERLNGISVALTETKSEPDRMALLNSRIASRAALPDPPERIKSEPTRDAILDVSTQIDDRIEKLREAQANLWTIHDKLWNAENMRSAARAEQQAKRAMMSAANLLASKMPSSKRRRPIKNCQQPE